MYGSEMAIPQDQPLSTSRKSIAPGEPKKIFIIDDDQEILLLLKETLNKDFNVFCANSYTELQVLLEQFIPDIAIIDINLPGQQDGFFCIQKLKERNSAIVNIAISGIANKKHMHQGILSRVFDFIEKPFDFNDIRKCVFAASGMLSERKLAEELSRENLYQIINLGLGVGDIVKEITEPILSIQFLVSEQLKNISERRPVESLRDSSLRIGSMARRIKEQVEKLAQSSMAIERHPKKISFLMMFRGAYAIFESMINRLNIQIEPLDSDMDAIVYCDPVEVGQLIINLIANSITAVASAQIRWMRFSLQIDKKYLYLTISDSRSKEPSHTLLQTIKDLFLPGEEEELEENISLCRKIAEKNKGSLKIKKDSSSQRYIFAMPYLAQ